MSPTTPVYALRYPASSDPADVPTDMGELALDVETVLTTTGHGLELAYVEITANVSASATTEATANTVVTAPALTLNGTTTVIVEFYSPLVRPYTTTGGTIMLWLFQDGASIGEIAQVQTPVAGNFDVPVRAARRLTPTAGSHTYSIRCSNGGNTGTVFAGLGGAGAVMPSFIRITRA